MGRGRKGPVPASTGVANEHCYVKRPTGSCAPVHVQQNARMRKVRAPRVPEATAPHKDLTSVTALHIGADKTVVRPRAQPEAAAAANNRAAGKRPCRR